MSREQNINFLVEMGFSRELATEAIKVHGYVEPAIAWCMKKQQESVGYTLGGTPQTLGSDSTSGQTLGHGEKIETGGHSLGSSESEIFPPPETEPKKQFTPEEKEAQLNAIKERIAARKTQAAIDDENSALQAEKHRREAGKEMQKTHEEYQKKQADLEALQKKRQKELDKLAHEKVMEQIRIDKLNREAEEARQKGQQVPSTTSTTTTATPKKEFKECVLQIRLPDGNKLQGNFKPEDNFHTVIQFVRETTKDTRSTMSLMTTFPKKVYEGDSLLTTLKDAGTFFYISRVILLKCKKNCY